MIPIIGWGVTTISLIQAELDNAAITDVSGMDVFIQAIPFNYYAILTLFMAGLLAFAVGLRPHAESAEQSHENR